MEKFNELKSFLESLQDDVDKFFNKENKAAGIRLTKGMQQVKALAGEIRQEVFKKKKEGK